MFKIYDGRDCFYQWDLNRKLIVNDDSIKEVHFCNRTEDCSLVCEVYTENGINLVNVPNILLQKCFCINVYAYDGESTKHSTLYKVKPRSKPADYVYTETEVKAWENLIERLDNLPIKEVTVENIAAPKIYIQDLEKGIYTIKSLWTGSTVQRIMLYSGNTSLGALGKGSILIVNNDSTIKNASSSFKKAFLLIQGGINDSAAVGVKSGTLTCTATTNADNTISWTYETESGNILTANDKASSITNDTDISKLPTVNAVKNFVKNNPVLLSERKYETIAEYTIEESGLTTYVLNKDNGDTLFLDSMYLFANIPTVEGETPTLSIKTVTANTTANSYTSHIEDYNLGTAKENEKYNILNARFDLIGYGSIFAALFNGNSINSIGAFGCGIAFNTVFKGIREVRLSTTNNTTFPVGTIIKVLGVRK